MRIPLLSAGLREAMCPGRTGSASRTGDGCNDGRDVAPRVSAEGRRAWTAPLCVENGATGGVHAVEQDRQQQSVFDGVRVRQSGPREQPQLHDGVEPHAPRTGINLAVWPTQE